MVVEALGNHPFAPCRCTDVSPSRKRKSLVARQYLSIARILDVPVALLDITVAKTHRCIVQHVTPVTHNLYEGYAKALCERLCVFAQRLQRAARYRHDKARTFRSGH